MENEHAGWKNSEKTGKEHDHLLSTLKEYIWIVTASSVKGPMSKMAEKRKHYTNF